MKKVILAILIAVFFVSCSPMSKEGYLKNFESFIEKTSQNYKEYTTVEWNKADKKLKKLTEEWYDKFEAEMSVPEKLKVHKYTLKYAYYKAYSEGKNAVNGLIDSIDIEGVKKDINTVTEDVVDTAKDLGKAVDSIATEWTR